MPCWKSVHRRLQGGYAICQSKLPVLTIRWQQSQEHWQPFSTRLSKYAKSFYDNIIFSWYHVKKKKDSTISYLQKLNSFGDTAAISIVNFLLNVDIKWNVQSIIPSNTAHFLWSFLIHKNKNRRFILQFKIQNVQVGYLLWPLILSSSSVCHIPVADV